MKDYDPWRGYMRLTVLIAVLTAWPTAASHADFFLGGTNNFRRYSDGGNLLHHSLSFGEVVGGMAYSPDGLLYVAGNDFGTGYIYRFNPSTNTFLDDPSFNLAFAGGTAQYSSPGAMAFHAGGHLFGIAFDKDLDGNITQQHVVRFDPSGSLMGALDGAILNPLEISAPRFADLAFRSNGDLYVAKSDGTIQRHTIGPADTTLVDTLTTGVDKLGSIAFGPDGLLYLREGTNNSILRYDVDTETLVDTFVSSVPFTNFISDGLGDYWEAGEIFFGPGGDLFAVNPYAYNDPTTVSRLVRLDGQDGSFVEITASMTPGLNNDSFNGIGVYVPVPEPSSLALVLPLAMATWATRRDLRTRFA